MDKIKSNARDLRSNLTLQEQELWRYLCNRRSGDFKFRCQHPAGSYILDFVCCSACVVIELDGGQHDLAVAYDSRRISWLESQGRIVLRFWNNEIDCNEEAVSGNILQRLNRRSSSPWKSKRAGRAEQLLWRKYGDSSGEHSIRFEPPQLLP